MATATVENNYKLEEKNMTNETMFNQVKYLLKFNSNMGLVQSLLNKIDTSYLLESNPAIKDWGKGLPRYTELFTLAFSEGHPQFNILLEGLVEDTKHHIVLTSRDIMHFVITGVFWRYYHSKSIENYAIREFQSSGYYDMTNIPFTLELDKLLEGCGLNNNYPNFKRYGEKLGYFNIWWLIDPSTYDTIECKRIDNMY